MKTQLKPVRNPVPRGLKLATDALSEARHCVEMAADFVAPAQSANVFDSLVTHARQRLDIAIAAIAFVEPRLPARR